MENRKNNFFAWFAIATLSLAAESCGNSSGGNDSQRAANASANAKPKVADPSATPVGDAVKTGANGTTVGQTSPSPSASPTDTMPMKPAPFKILTPSLDGDQADQSYTVKIQVEPAVAFDGIWKLFSTQQKGDLSKGTHIITRVGSSSDAVWNTSALAAGTYYLYIQFSSGSSTWTVAAAGSVFINHPPPGPYLALSSPNGGEGYLAGTTVKIQYAATSPVAADLVGLVYTVEYSADSGSSWNPAGTTSNSTFNWQIPVGLAQGTTYRVRVKTTMKDGKQLQNQSLSDFGIMSTAITYTNTIRSTLAASCAGASCHSSGGAQAGRMNLDSYQSVFNVRASMLRAIVSNFMPPPSGGVSASDQQKIKLWVWSGAPN